MQDDKTGGVPIRTVKSFLSKIPSVVTGKSRNWLNSIWDDSSSQQQSHGRSLAPALLLSLTSARLSSCSAPSAVGGLMSYVQALLAWIECCHASLVHTALPVHFTPVLPCFAFASPVQHN
ncbi:hypothetical protein EK904_009524 [Melospiza melodia maxima]|nr:hypothetical protein EK904_009524 [Melospiza melodia maxima]